MKYSMMSLAGRKKILIFFAAQNINVVATMEPLTTEPALLLWYTEHIVQEHA
jgi:hypothetical protein